LRLAGKPFVWTLKLGENEAIFPSFNEDGVETFPMIPDLPFTAYTKRKFGEMYENGCSPITQFRLIRHERVPKSGEFLTGFEQGDAFQWRIRQPGGKINRNKEVRLYWESVVALQGSSLFIVAPKMHTSASKGGKHTWNLRR
jgi:hypothetical protein